ncbi:hypothetical protein [Vibrio neptunius]|uniref:Uncharacterized protein n=1 Tax=Vibrio neptunius TaxID=170651 RepID=A0ABS3A841_9VIBR|nr:hypothetical protein [Vibrio neptunius]MBN3495697.1 hypothetical protein [Vibrio neptunius]MBN3518138.1 hypothetical protein [Vibrio neptunius]MBN3552471.1 hypothetical protein [Vibrio neptunius]MBN3580528.1 hypothetical protein [Vibrio neptunius]MCH9874195.1 hypothetical protein [Vibrio neptunius]
MNKEKLLTAMFNVLDKLSSRYFSITIGLLTIGWGIKLLSHFTDFWWLRFLFSPQPLFGEQIFTLWATILAIHGTIAALSLTLSSSLIDRIAENFNPSLEKFARQSVFKRLRFQTFSNWSISSLTIGIGWLALQGGIILYILSTMMSILFLFIYAYVYRQLQAISISPTLMSKFIEEEIKEAKKNERDLTKRIENVTSANYTTLKFIGIEPKTYRKFYKEAVLLNDSHSGLIYKYDKNKLASFFDVMNQKEIIDFTISVCPGRLDLNAPLRYCNNGLSHNELYELESAFLDSLSGCVQGNALDVINELASQFQLNVYDHASKLASHDELRESIRLLFLLMDEKNVKRNFDSLLHLFIENKVNLSQNSDVVLNLKRAMVANYPYNDTSLLCVFIFQLAQNLLDTESYSKFIKDESDFFLRFVTYRCETEDQLRRFLLQPLVDISELRIVAASDLIKEISASDKYYDLDPDSSNHEWNAVVRMSFYIEALSLLTLRLDSIVTDDKADKERELILKTVNSIINASVFNELFYHEFIYHEIFRIRRKFSCHSAESNLRNIKNGDVYTDTSRHFYNQARTLLLFGVPNGSQSFSIDFINDVELLLKKTNFTTWELKDLLNYVASEKYKQLLSFLANDVSDEELILFVEQVLGKLNTFSAQIQAIVDRQIANAALEPSLTCKTIKEVTEQFNKEINNVFPEIELLDTKSNIKTPLPIVIDKRSFLPPIDGVSVANPSRRLAKKLMHSFLLSMVDYLNDTEHTVKECLPEEVEKFNGHWITVINGEMQRDLTAPLGAYFKGYKLRDKNNMLDLCDAGLYYIKIDSASLSLAKTKNKQISLEIITTDSPDFTTHFEDDFDLMNKEQTVAIKTEFNLALRYTSPLPIYFLPVSEMLPA